MVHDWDNFTFKLIHLFKEGHVVNNPVYGSLQIWFIGPLYYIVGNYLYCVIL